MEHTEDDIIDQLHQGYAKFNKEDATKEFFDERPPEEAIQAAKDMIALKGWDFFVRYSEFSGRMTSIGATPEEFIKFGREEFKHDREN